MKHLQTDYEAITKAIQENPFDSEEDVRKIQLEIVEFMMAFVAELEKRDRRIEKLVADLSEMGEDVDELLDGLSKNYLDAETGARIVERLQGGMQLIVTLVKILEDEFNIDDIKKHQIRSAVEPHLQGTTALLADLEDIIDTEEEEDDGDTDDTDDGDGDGGDDGDPDGDGDAEDEEGAAEEGA